jgi:hypothetical protein
MVVTGMLANEFILGFEDSLVVSGDFLGFVAKPNKRADGILF